MPDEKDAASKQPHEASREDILEAEAHGQEPPQSDEGMLSGRAADYGHADQDREPTDDGKPDDEA
ncbi:MAG: hypothetical protein ACTHMX_00550 [Thermomicrobiales bacterium]